MNNNPRITLHFLNIALLVAVCTLLSVLTGCGTDTEARSVTEERRVGDGVNPADWYNVTTIPVRVKFQLPTAMREFVSIRGLVDYGNGVLFIPKTGAEFGNVFSQLVGVALDENLDVIPLGPEVARLNRVSPTGNVDSDYGAGVGFWIIVSARKDSK